MGDRRRLLLEGVRRTEGKEKPVSIAVAVARPPTPTAVMVEVERHLVHGIARPSWPVSSFPNAR
jgi:hypothetical protein